jgi:bifunctional non-homologous end joining protein LigD
MHVRLPSDALLAAVPVHYQVFDLLSLDGASLLARPYQQRRALLEQLPLHGHLPPGVRRRTRHVGRRRGRRGPRPGGVVAKRRNSLYRPGRTNIDAQRPSAATAEAASTRTRP